MRFGQAFLITTGTQGVIYAFGFVSGVVLTRAIGAEGRGVYSLILTIVGLLSLLMGGGLNCSNIYHTGKDKEKAAIIFSNSILFGIGISILIWLMYYALPQKVVSLAFRGVDENYINFTIFLVIITIFSSYFASIYLGLQEFTYYNLFSLVQSFSFLVLNVLFLYVFKYKVEGVIYAWLLSSIISLFGSVLFIFNRIQNLRFCPSLAQLIKGLKVGGRAIIAALLAQLLMRANIFLINYFMDLKVVGIYSVALWVTEIMLKIPSIGGTVLFPKISSGINEENVRLTIKLSKLMGLFGIFISIVLLASGNFLLPYVFGDEFKASYLVMVLLLPGMIGLSVNSILANFYAGKGYPFIVIWSTFAAFIINLILNLLLIPPYGLIGASISTSISYLLLTLIMGAYFAREYSVFLASSFGKA